MDDDSSGGRRGPTPQLRRIFTPTYFRRESYCVGFRHVVLYVRSTLATDLRTCPGCLSIMDGIMGVRGLPLVDGLPKVGF